MPLQVASVESGCFCSITGVLGFWCLLMRCSRCAQTAVESAEAAAKAVAEAEEAAALATRLMAAASRYEQEAELADPGEAHPISQPAEPAMGILQAPLATDLWRSNNVKTWHCSITQTVESPELVMCGCCSCSRVMWPDPNCLIDLQGLKLWREHRTLR